MGKWTKYWLIYGAIFFAFILLCLIFREETWISILIQLGTLVLTVIAMLLVMFQNGDQLKQSTTSQLDSLKTTTQEQIIEMQKLTDRQVNSYQTEIEKLILVLQNSTEEQIQVLNQQTQKSIESAAEETEKITNNFKDSTDKQIKNFTDKTDETINALEEVAKVLLQMSDQNKTLIQESENNRLATQKLLEKKNEELYIIEYEKEQKSKRNRPLVSISLLKEDFIGLFPSVKAFVFNQGGIVQAVNIECVFYNENAHAIFYINSGAIRRRGSNKFKVCRFSQIKQFHSVQFKITTFDQEGKQYFGQTQTGVLFDTWTFIPLDEQYLLD